MSTLAQDLRFAFRTLLKAPGFAAAVIVTIALGVGATTAMWTVVDRILLRPLPFPGSERTMMLCETSAKTANVCVASPANVADWGRSVPALEAVGVARNESFIASTGGASFGIRGGLATNGFFAAIGLTPALGRVLEPTDLDPSRNQVVVISDTLWRERFGQDPRVVGRTFTLDGRDTRIVGVLPPHPYIPTLDFVDAWKPITAGIDDAGNRDWRGFMAIGRMAPGATAAELDAQLDVAAHRLAMTYPESNAGWGVRTMSVRDYVVGPIGRTLWLFLGAVGFVMLIACANVANLLLVRASARQPEFAVRASLGAGARRLLRQVLTESLVIAAAGGAAGLLLAMYATTALVAMAPATLPRLDEVSPDGRVAIFAIVLTTLAAVVFGVAPARLASRARLTSALTTARHTARGSTRARSVLVVSELALAMVLLVGAGLTARAFARLTSWNPGFDRDGVTISWALVPQSTFKTAPEAVAALERVRAAVETVPGVVRVGLGSAGPLFGGTETGGLSIAGRPSAGADAAPTVNWFDADAHYLTALGRRVVRGRGITDDDAQGTRAIAVVNETFARTFFAGLDPIGARVTVEDHPADVVGVVSDVQPFPPDQPPAPEIFWPIRQFPRYAAYLVMRIAPGVGGIEEAIQARVAGVHPGIQVTPLVPIDRIVTRTLVGPRFYLALIGMFAFVAIALAAVGVYGVIASSVASRQREMGLRIALGATPGRLVWRVVGQAMTLASIGLALGVAGAIALGRLLTSLLHGVPVTDTVTLVATTAGFLAITAIAGFIPARRASRIDPLTALRSE